MALSVASAVHLEITFELMQASNGNDAQEDIVNAMALTGQFLMGQAVMVKSSEVNCVNSLLIMMQSSKVHKPAVSSALFLRVAVLIICHSQTQRHELLEFHQTPHEITLEGNITFYFGSVKVCLLADIIGLHPFCDAFTACADIHRQRRIWLGRLLSSRLRRRPS